MRASTRSRRSPSLTAAMRWCSTPKAALVRSTEQVATGDQLTTRLSDGAFISRVESTATNSNILAKIRRQRDARNETMTATATHCANSSAPTASAPSPANPRSTPSPSSPAASHWPTPCAKRAPSPKSFSAAIPANPAPGSPPLSPPACASRSPRRKRRHRPHPRRRLPRPHTWISGRRGHLRLAQSLARQRHQALRRRRLQARRRRRTGHGRRNPPSRLPASHAPDPATLPAHRGQRRPPGRLHPVPHRLRPRPLARRPAHRSRLRQRSRRRRSPPSFSAASASKQVALSTSPPTAATSTTTAALCIPTTWLLKSQSRGAALGLTFDGDADRCMMAGSSNNVINGDAILLYRRPRPKSPRPAHWRFSCRHHHVQHGS